MRYLITFSYDGTNYAGYQKQPNLKTIQEEIEKALKYINNNNEVILQSSGRTDKKVHALKQTAHFDLDVEITENKLKRAINSNTPKDIYIINAVCVEDEFHARYMVKLKEYRYIINEGEYDPINRNYEFQYGRKLNIVNMKEAIKYLKNNKLIITFKGTGFMKYQVRNMVGILIRVGEDKILPIGVKEILESKDRNKTGKTAPAEGLYLVNVSYK